ncbi:MAG TPA: hypothetical protein VGA94_06145 [Thermodesulfobacteriota bacterium]
MRILFYLAVWKRPEITKICFQGLKRLRNYYPNSLVHVVLSEDYYKNECEKFGFSWTEAPNKPIGAKKNTGLKDALSRHKFDYMIELGSDDLIANDVIDIYLRVIEKGYDLFGLNRVGIIDSMSGKCINYKALIMGNGRCISRKALEKAGESYFCRATETFIGNNNTSMCRGDEQWVPAYRISRYHEIISEVDFRLWASENNWALDGCSNAILEKCGYKYTSVDTSRILLLDIKGEENIGKFENFRGEGITLDQCVEDFPEKEEIKKLIFERQKNYSAA